MEARRKYSLSPPSLGVGLRSFVYITGVASAGLCGLQHRILTSTNSHPPALLTTKKVKSIYPGGISGKTATNKAGAQY